MTFTRDPRCEQRLERPRRPGGGTVCRGPVMNAPDVGGICEACGWSYSPEDVERMRAGQAGGGTAGTQTTKGD